MATATTKTGRTIAEHAGSLCDIGREFHQRGWSLATSSNYNYLDERTDTKLLGAILQAALAEIAENRCRMQARIASADTSP